MDFSEHFCVDGKKKKRVSSVAQIVRWEGGAGSGGEGWERTFVFVKFALDGKLVNE